MNMQNSSTLEGTPSIPQVFRPKTFDRRIVDTPEAPNTDLVQAPNQCNLIFVNSIDGDCNFKPLLLAEVPTEHLVLGHQILSSAHLYQGSVSGQRICWARLCPQKECSSDRPSSSSANNVYDQSASKTFRSPETTSSSFPTFSNKTPMNLNKYVTLYRAALKGDWDQAQGFMNAHPGSERARITKGWETALHIAAGAKQTEFVEELVKMMTVKDLEIQNKDGNTALCFAVASGIVRIAEVMAKENNNLPRLRGSLGVTPLYLAALLGNRDMVWYLNSVTDDGEHLKVEDFFGILVAAITSGLYDVALHILWNHPHLATYHGRNGETALHVLARKPSAFTSGTQLGIWQRCIYSWIYVEPPDRSKHLSSSFGYQTPVQTQDDRSLTMLLWDAVKLLVPGVKSTYEKKLENIQALELVKCLWEEVKIQGESRYGDLLRSPSEPLFTATEFGIVEFVAILLYSYPDLIWKVDSQNRSLFHIAIMHRREKIFRMIYDIGAHKDLITSYRDESNCNILHLAGILAPSYLLNVVSGAALQMQRELLWFKEVEKIVQPLYREMRDVQGRTPQMLFTEEHRGLVKEGEKWMKNTSSSCMLVATLITTVMFAAIFTVPGGDSNDKGTPVLLQAKAFIAFALSDAFALFSSVTSILMFLSILTSRYAEEDFLKSLPRRLSIGIGALFLSIVAMLIAFSATFFLVLGHQWAWIVIPLAAIACLLVTVFAFLHFPLLFDTLHYTYGSGIFSPKQKIYGTYINLWNMDQ